jgi:hypothetical protein
VPAFEACGLPQDRSTRLRIAELFVSDRAAACQNYMLNAGYPAPT